MTNKPEWLIGIEKKAKSVEDKAARLAYEAGLGASEWKSFCSSADLAILDLLSYTDKLREALEESERTISNMSGMFLQTDNHICGYDGNCGGECVMASEVGSTLSKISQAKAFNPYEVK